MTQRRRLKVKTNFIARHRRSWPLRKLARLCEKYLDAYGNWSYDPARNGERRVLEAWKRQPPEVVFDVGANKGNWTALVRQLLPQAAVHCFEIAPPTAASLIDRFRDDALVRVIERGLADRAGEVSLVYYPMATGLTSVYAFPHRHVKETIVGHTMTGDAYMAEHGIRRIDFLKIDVEGAEWEVLQGFNQALDAGRIQAIQFEYGRKSILTKHLLRDHYLLLEEKGFAVGKIYPTYVDFRPYRFQDEDFRGPNYLAVRKERQDLLRALA